MRFQIYTHRVLKHPYHFQSYNACVKTEQSTGIVYIQGDEMTLVLQTDIDYLAIRTLHEGRFLSEIRDERNGVDCASFKPDNTRIERCSIGRQSEHAR